jgi:hypothetical protein
MPTKKRTEALREKERAAYWKRKGYDTPPEKTVVVSRSVDAPVSVRKRPTVSGEVDMSRAKITIAPEWRDLRFVADPGFVGEFATAGIGRYVE